MIEIELKLQVDKFPDMGEPLKEKRVVDKYFDTEDYKLIATGNFLRNRNNKMVDFKLNIGDLSHSYCRETGFDYDKFVPSKSLELIFNAIGLKYNSNFSNFEEFLKVNQLKELAEIDKVRRTYKIDDLEISLDDAKDIGKFIEIEYDLPDGTEFDKDEIINFMIKKMQDICCLDNYKKVNIGYVELYLKKHNKKAYNLGLFKE